MDTRYTYTNTISHIQVCIRVCMCKSTHARSNNHSQARWKCAHLHRIIEMCTHAQTTFTHTKFKMYRFTLPSTIPKQGPKTDVTPPQTRPHYSLSVFVFVWNLTQSLWLVMSWPTQKEEIHANPNNLFTLMPLFKHGRTFHFPSAISNRHKSATTHYM